MRHQEPDRRFVEMYNAHYQAIHRYFVRRSLDSEAEAADLAAEVFLVAWRRLTVVPSPPHDRAWLYGVARRLLHRHRRAVWRRRRLTLHLATVATIGEQGAQGAESARIEEVRAALAGLSRRDQEIVRLVMWDGLSHAEAAQVVGGTANAVAIKMHRIRRRLGEALADRRPDPPAEQALQAGDDAAAPRRPATFTDQAMKKGHRQ